MTAGPDAVYGEDVSTPDALTRFCRDSLPTVYGYVMRLAGGDRALAEDLTQDTFVALTAELRKGRSECADVRWLLTVARHRHLDHLRRLERADRNLRLIVNEAIEDDAEPTRDLVLEVVEGMEPMHRTVLMLRYVDGLPVPEVAELIERSTTATYSLLARARAELRRQRGATA